MQASSGKDRRICIWRKKQIQISAHASPAEDLGGFYHLSAVKAAAHKRIVWSLHWCPLHPSMLATGSRDGFVKIWNVTESHGAAPVVNQVYSFQPVTKYGKAEPVTAVSFAPKTLPKSGDAILAIGLERGQIELWSVPVSFSKASCQVLHVVNLSNCHLGVVKKIEWRPSPLLRESDSAAPSEEIDLSFATCSSDHGVRIFELCWV